VLILARKVWDHRTERAQTGQDATTSGTLLTRWLWVRVPRDPLPKGQGRTLATGARTDSIRRKAGGGGSPTFPLNRMGSRDPVQGGWDVTDTKEL
jgi:hypothetical protein